MPALGALLIGLFNLIVPILARFMVLQKAAALAAWVITLGLIAALFTSAFSCVNGACAATISGMSSSHPAFGMGLHIAINPTTLTCVSCYMATWILCQVYVIKKKAVDLVVKA
jgi:hypothetical protein